LLFQIYTIEKNCPR